MKKFTSGLIAVGIVLVIAGGFMFMNSAPSDLVTEIVAVKKGDTMRSVAHALAERNIVRSEAFMYRIAQATGRTAVIAGRYKVHPGTTAFEIVQKINRGDIIRRKVTIPEGYNIYQIAKRLQQNEVVRADAFLALVADPAFLASIGINAPLAEGYLFPDTYTFAEDADPRAVITMMHNRLQKVLDGLDLSPLKKHSMDLHALLTLASMVEKEARVPQERRYIAAVFHNRKRLGMRFDCDPTVRYAVKRWKGPIYRSDLNSNSPYNTYVHAGFPPTPICSPGRDAIRASLNPEKVSFLYFVARNDGSHYFSTTVQEHNRAVQFYQRGVNNGFVDTQKLPR